MDTAPRLTRSRAKAMADGSNTPAAAEVTTRGSKTTATRTTRGQKTGDGTTPAPVSKLAFGEKENNANSSDDTSMAQDQQPDKLDAPMAMLSPLQEVQLPSKGAQSVEESQETAIATPAEDKEAVAEALPAVAHTAVPENETAAERLKEEPVVPESMKEMQEVEAVAEVPLEQAVQEAEVPQGESLEEVHEAALEAHLATPETAAAPPPAAPKSAIKPEFMSALHSMEVAVAEAMGEEAAQEQDAAVPTSVTLMEHNAQMVGVAPSCNSSELSLSEHMVHFAVPAETDASQEHLEVGSTCEAAEAYAAMVQAALPQLVSPAPTTLGQVAATPGAETCPAQAPAMVDFGIADITVKRVSICTPLPSHAYTAKKAVVYTPYPKSESAEPEEMEQQQEMEMEEGEIAQERVEAPGAGPCAVAPATESDPYGYRTIREPNKEEEIEREDVQGLEEDDGEAEAPYSEATENLLATAMDDLGIAAKRDPLRGLPLPQGHHFRFNEEGDANLSPTSGKIVLRGLPEPKGTHIRFD